MTGGSFVFTAAHSRYDSQLLKCTVHSALPEAQQLPGWAKAASRQRCLLIS